SLWMINTVFLLPPIINHQTNTIKLIFEMCSLDF
ncbi:hypothetical protein KGH44_002446, partial [Escherichia coli]|nr:hypothetical protein [Escherichia coli]